MLEEVIIVRGAVHLDKVVLNTVTQLIAKADDSVLEAVSVAATLRLMGQGTDPCFPSFVVHHQCTLDHLKGQMIGRLTVLEDDGAVIFTS